MKQVVVVLMVLALLALTVGAFAQPAPGGGGNGGGGGGRGGGGMRGGGFQPAPAPAMLAAGDSVFVELGGWLYKIDPTQMKVVGQVFLTPPAAVDANGAAAAPAGGGMGGRRGPQSTPVMMASGDMLFVELGDVLYKVDPAQMKLLGSCTLVAPGGAEAGAAAPLPPPPPPAQ